MLKTPRRLLVTIALATAVACGDDGTGPTGTITVSASPTALTIAQGSSGSVTVTLVRGGGFGGAVNVSVSGLPSGVTASVSPAQLTGSTTQATVTVNVASTVIPGTYTATVTASAAGIGSATATYALTVTAQDFALSGNAVTAPQGGAGNTTISIARTDFTGAVALTLLNPPSGITATFNPTPATGNSSTMSVNVAGTVATGNQTLTVQGTGGGLTRTTTITLTVTPGITLSLAPSTLSIGQGGSSQSTLTAVRGTFTGNITPSVSGNPAGMTVSFNPTPMTGNTSTVTVNVGAAVPTGNYTLTIAGNTGGAAGTPTATLGVTVTQSSGLVWEFCNSDDLPLKFWRLSGGTWSEVTPTTAGNVTRYTFTIAPGQGGVAFVVSNSGFAARQSAMSPTRTGFRSVAKDSRTKAFDHMKKVAGQNVSLTSPFFDTVVFFGLDTELGGFAESCTPAPATVGKSFTVSNQPANEEGLLGYGGAEASLNYTVNNYNLSVVAGTYDWLSVWGPSPNFPDLSHNWQSYRIGRGEAAPGGQVAINRTGAPALIPFAFTVSGGVAGSFYNFNQSLEGARGEVVSIPLGALLATSGSGNMLFPQPADRLPTDLWALTVANTEFDGNNLNSRSQVRYIGSGPPANGNFALPAAVPAFTTAQVVGAPVTTWRAQGSTPADYQNAASVVSVALTGGGGGQLYTIAASRGWLTANGMSAAYTLTAPTLPGFLAAWAPAAPLDDATVIMLGTNATTAPVAGTVANVAFRLQSPP